MLLKEHCNRITPDETLLESVSQPISERSSFFQSIRTQETHNSTNVQRVRDFGNTVLNGMSTSSLSLQGSGNCVEEERLSEPVGTEDTKETVCSSHNRTDAQRLWQHAEGLHKSQPDGALALRWGCGHPFPNQEATAIDNHLQRKQSLGM